MPDLTDLDATALAGAIKSGAASAEAVVRAHLDRIARYDGSINAFVTLDAERALAQARHPRPGPLSGVPVTIKDSFDTAGLRTTRGSRMFEDLVPDRDAPAVARLRAAGAIVLGKTNVPELTYWTETDNGVAGRTNNPWRLDRTPGGSSGGESAAIAAHFSPLGLGSDVAISVRGPASNTGIAALKPTFGRISTEGHSPRALLRWWHTGPMARTVRDLRLAFSVLSARRPDADGLRNGAPVRRLRVGWCASAFGSMSREILSALHDAAGRFGEMEDVLVEETELAGFGARDYTTTSQTLFTGEMQSHVRTLLAADPAFDPGLLTAPIAALLRAEVPDAEHVRSAEEDVTSLRADLARFFQRFDVLLTQVTPFVAPLHDRPMVDVDGSPLPARAVMRATVPFNLTGLPCVVVPFRLSSDGVPFGVQLVGRPGEDEVLLDVAERLEAAAGLRRRPSSGSRTPEGEGRPT